MGYHATQKAQVQGASRLRYRVPHNKENLDISYIKVKLPHDKVIPGTSNQGYHTTRKTQEQITLLYNVQGTTQ